MNKYSQRNLRHLVMIAVTARQNFNPHKSGFNDPLQVVYAGSFGDKDGVNDIIAGFNTFNETYKNARLILTGKSDEQAKYQEKYKDNANLVFKGRVSDEEFYDILRNADVMCMCRTNSDFANAGFPFKLGEYLATGNPVISTKASDVEYYLSDEDAYLIDSESPQQICAALKHIVSKPEEARIIGLNGKKKCEQFFSPEANGKILYDMLVKISTE
jgi:glycosyltransferase involved in cell wall biosynthesis